VEKSISKKKEEIKFQILISMFIKMSWKHDGRGVMRSEAAV